MPFESYLKRGLLKRQRANFKQIEVQVIRAKKDVQTAQLVLKKDPEWAATIAYHAMLRMGRALLFAKGYLPADGGQHRTVVELTGTLLDTRDALLVEKFERMRRRRNLFFYESDPFGTLTDAEHALETASQLIHLLEAAIQREHPQLHFEFHKPKHAKE